jgi:hypothetical protein
MTIDSQQPEAAPGERENLLEDVIAWVHDHAPV